MQHARTHFPDKAELVTPSDTDRFDEPSTILVVDGGDVVCEPWDSAGSSVTLAGVPAYFTIPFRVAKVMATGTTATNMIRVFE